MKPTRIYTVLLVFVTTCFCVDGQDLSLKLMKAQSLKNSGRYSEALEFLGNAIRNSVDSRLYVLKGETEIKAGLLDEAVKDFSEASNLTPGSGDLGLARVYSMKNMPARSVAFLESHMSSDQKQPEKSILLDESFSAIENSPEWRGFWKREHYNGLERAISEIEFYVSRGKAQEAAASLGDINSSYRNTQGARYASSIYFMATGKMQEAVSMLESLVSEEPSNMKYLGKLAEVQMTTGNYAGATNTLSKILELGTSDATILYSRAESYRKTSEYDKALSDINTYLGMYPSDRKAISLAGHIKADSGDNLEAIRLFSENIKQNPGDPAVYLDRADSYFVGKAWTMAINDYAMSLDLEPENGDAWLSKGLALYNIGKQEDACIHFRKALSLGNKRASGFISRYCIK